MRSGGDAPGWGTTVPGNRWDLLGTGTPAQPGSGEPVEPPFVTVVVAHFEQPAQLARTLAALRAQTHPASRLDVVVADDGSRRAPEVPAGVRLVRQADRGFRAAAARNLGAREPVGGHRMEAASRRVLVFLDADTVPEPAYVERVSRLPALLPEALVVGRRRHADLTGLPVDAALPPPRERWLGDPAWLDRGYVETRNLLDVDETSFRFVISAVCACSAWLFDRLGGFDETFVGYGGEDWDLAHRAFRAGAILAHEPDAVAWHDGPDRGARDHDALAALRESLAVAGRIGVPGVRGRGLLLGAAEVAVTAAPGTGPDPTGLDPTGLVIAADDLLAALPSAHLLLDDEAAALLQGDPRVRPAGADLADDTSPYGVRVHLHRAVRADPRAWTDLLDRLWGRPGGTHARVTVADEDGPLVSAISLPAVRRQRRWGREDLFPSTTLTDDRFRPVPPGTTLGGHLGGWQ